GACAGDERHAPSQILLHDVSLYRLYVCPAVLLCQAVECCAEFAYRSQGAVQWQFPGEAHSTMQMNCFFDDECRIGNGAGEGRARIACLAEFVGMDGTANG